MSMRVHPRVRVDEFSGIIPLRAEAFSLIVLLCVFFCCCVACFVSVRYCGGVLVHAGSGAALTVVMDAVMGSSNSSLVLDSIVCSNNLGGGLSADFSGGLSCTDSTFVLSNIAAVGNIGEWRDPSFLCAAVPRKDVRHRAKSSRESCCQ